MHTASLRSPVARLAALFALLLVLVSQLLSGSAAADEGDPEGDPTAANDTLSFGIGPAGVVPEGQVVDGRPYLNYVANPGATITDSVALFNFEDVPLKLQVYATDAVNAADGAFSLLPGGDRPADAGRWIKLDVPKNGRVTVPPRTADGYGRLEIPLTISIPPDATPGDHVGGVLASLKSTDTNDQGAQLTLDQRIGLRTYFRLTGELVPEVRVENLKASYEHQNDPLGRGRTEVSYTVHNVGNMRLSATQDVTVDRLLVGDLVGHPTTLVDLLPGARVDVTQVFDNAFGLGPLEAQVTLHPSPTDTSYDGTVSVATASTKLWAWPWVLLAIIGAAILLLLVLFFGIRHRRRRKRLQKETSARHSAKKAAVTALVGFLVAGPLVLGSPAAHAERPDDSLGEVMLETNDVTGVPRLALLEGLWGHEGGKKQKNLGATYISMNAAAKNGGVTPKSLAALHEKLADGGTFDNLRVAFVPYSADGSNERPRVEEGDTVADAFTWFGDFGFGTPLAGNPTATDSVATVSTGAEYIEWWDAGRPLQGYTEDLSVIDIDDEGSGQPTATPQGKSILNRWPAGTKISMVLYLSDGTDETRPGLPKVAVGKDGRAMTSWLTFRTVAKPGDAVRSSAGYEILTGEGTGPDAPLPPGGLDAAINGGQGQGGGGDPADGATDGATDAATDTPSDGGSSESGDGSGSGTDQTDGDEKSTNALVDAVPGGTPAFAGLLMLLIVGAVVLATLWLRRRPLR